MGTAHVPCINAISPSDSLPSNSHGGVRMVASLTIVLPSHVLSRHVLCLTFASSAFSVRVAMSCARRAPEPFHSQLSKRDVPIGTAFRLTHSFSRFPLQRSMFGDRFICIHMPYAVCHYSRHSFSSSLFPRASLVWILLSNRCQWNDQKINCNVHARTHGIRYSEFHTHRIERLFQQLTNRARMMDSNLPICLRIVFSTNSAAHICFGNSMTIREKFTQKKLKTHCIQTDDYIKTIMYSAQRTCSTCGFRFPSTKENRFEAPNKCVFFFLLFPHFVGVWRHRWQWLRAENAERRKHLSAYYGELQWLLGLCIGGYSSLP